MATPTIEHRDIAGLSVRIAVKTELLGRHGGGHGNALAERLREHDPGAASGGAEPLYRAVHLAQKAAHCPYHAVIAFAKQAREEVLANQLAKKVVRAVASLQPRVDEVDEVSLVTAFHPVLSSPDALHLELQGAEKAVGIYSTCPFDVDDREDSDRVHRRESPWWPDKQSPPCRGHEGL